MDITFLALTIIFANGFETWHERTALAVVCHGQALLLARKAAAKGWSIRYSANMRSLATGCRALITSVNRHRSDFFASEDLTLRRNHTTPRRPQLPAGAFCVRGTPHRIRYVLVGTIGGKAMASTDRALPRDKRQPRPSKPGAGPDIDAGRTKTQTEKDLRRVQGQYAKTDSFDPKK